MSDRDHLTEEELQQEAEEFISAGADDLIADIEKDDKIMRNDMRVRGLVTVVKRISQWMPKQFTADEREEELERAASLDFREYAESIDDHNFLSDPRVEGMIKSGTDMLDEADAREAQHLREIAALRDEIKRLEDIIKKK